MPAALAAAPRGRVRHVYLHYSIGERIGALCAGRHACPVVAAGCSVLSSCHMMVGCTPMRPAMLWRVVLPSCHMAGVGQGVHRSRFRPLSVVTACLHGVQNCAREDGDSAKAKAHGKLAVAYSSAGRHADALQSLAIAQRHAVPGSRWEHFLKLESAENLLSVGRTDEAQRCLLGVMPTLLQLPTSLPEASLYAHCCMLLAKTNVQTERRDAAKSWLRRAIDVQGDFGLHGPLATTMQLYSELLSRDNEYQEAKTVLQDAEGIMSLYETDEYLKCRVQVDLGVTEVQLGQLDSAQARLSGALVTLRKRKRDHFSARLVPVAARALSCLVRPARRLRRKTLPEHVDTRVAS